MWLIVGSLVAAVLLLLEIGVVIAAIHMLPRARTATRARMGMVFVSGVVGLILGALIWAQGPAGAVWLLGVWFGLNLLSDGIGIVMVSSLIRSRIKQLDSKAAPVAG